MTRAAQSLAVQSLATSSLALLLLGGCAVGDRSLESTHQPVVAADGASVPGCPNWSNTLGGERESQSSNYGCATNANLAAMVANPADLLHGQGDGTSDADTAAKSLRAWREAAATSKQWITTSNVERTSSGGPK